MPFSTETSVGGLQNYLEILAEPGLGNSLNRSGGRFGEKDANQFLVQQPWEPEDGSLVLRVI